jgi:hypothetical protein
LYLEEASVDGDERLVEIALDDAARAQKLIDLAKA